MASDDRLNALAQVVVRMGEIASDSEAQTEVFKVAVLALVQTHPDPAAFRAAFQRGWLRSGSPRAISQRALETSAPVDAALDQLEEALGRELGVRPPRR